VKALATSALMVPSRQACRIFGDSRPSASAWRTSFSVMPYCRGDLLVGLAVFLEPGEGLVLVDRVQLLAVMAVVSENLERLVGVDLVQVQRIG
jgi:hypothetical protein